MITMKKFATVIPVIAGLLMITLFSSFIIKGNGNVVSEKRNVSEFTAIDVSHGFDVIITQGDACTVEVEADENLQEVIVTKVKNGVLHAYAKESIRKATKMTIYISFKELEMLEASGAVDLETAGVVTGRKLEVRCSGASDLELFVEYEDIRIDVSGASDLDIEGSAHYLNADVSGASDIDAFQLDAAKVIVDASGASNIKVHALKSIEAEASGASDIKYKGNPEILGISTSGAGDVRKL